MSKINDYTQKINGQLASLKTISEKAKSKKDRSSSDVNNIMDSIIGIINQLGGYNDIIKSIENVISTKLEDIESTIKGTIKTALKQTLSCGVEPTITSELITSGVTFSLKSIDPLSMFSIDPESENGELVYYDNNSDINSKDFNVFLYTLIKNSINVEDYGEQLWYYNEIVNDVDITTALMYVSYNEYNSLTKQSNVLTIKIHEDYLGKKLSYFISNYLDSVKLFNNVQIISTIFDEILGSKIFSINKTSEQLVAEKMVTNIVDKILNNIDDEDVVDDSFYTFSNDVYNQMLEDSEKKLKGKFTYTDDNSNDIKINEDLLRSSLSPLKDDGLLISQQTKILTDTIDSIVNDLNDNNKVKDKYSFSLKFDIVKKIINKLMTTITVFMFTPKIMYTFILTTKLLGVEDEEDVKTFIKNNINVYKTIIIKIRDIIIQELIDKIKELLSPILTQVVSELAKERMGIYKKQFDSIKDSIYSAYETVKTLTEKTESTATSVEDKLNTINSTI